jgi:hypothetical protein
MTIRPQVLAIDQLRTPTARGARSLAPQRRALVIGAAGILGSAVLRLVVGSHQFAQVGVATTGPMQVMLEGVHAVDVDEALADVVIIVLDKPVVSAVPVYVQQRHRESVLLQPMPDDVPRLAALLRQRGARVLVVVTPINQAELPNALRLGLRDLKEQTLTQLGYEHVLLIRPAQRSRSTSRGGFLQRLGLWMVSVFRYMVPQQEQPVLSEKVAAFVSDALGLLPQAEPGIYVADATTLWQSAQPTGRTVVRRWLRINSAGDRSDDVPQPSAESE